MDKFLGIILICLSTVPPAACDEETALDVLAVTYRSELECLSGWQEVVGRSALRDGVGETTYVKTLCRRISRTEPAAPGREG
jgi:hypothetical protein